MGYKIKEFRIAKRMSQEELAKKSGVSRGTIVALEKDNAYITTTKTLLMIANALGVQVEDIFFTSGV